MITVDTYSNFPAFGALQFGGYFDSESMTFTWNRCEESCTASTCVTLTKVQSGRPNNVLYADRGDRCSQEVNLVALPHAAQPLSSRCEKLKIQGPLRKPLGDKAKENLFGAHDALVYQGIAELKNTVFGDWTQRLPPLAASNLDGWMEESRAIRCTCKVVGLMVFVKRNVTV